MTFQHPVSGVLDVGELTAGQKVYCIICITENPPSDIVHIFSTKEKAQDFADADRARNHIFYDYVIDCPERMEGRTQ